MEERYQKFTEFNWSDERWQAHLSGLYPEPNYKQVLKFKKKWYKKNIDPEFNETYEPAAFCGAGNCASSNCGGGGRSSVPEDGREWRNMGGMMGRLCVSVYSSGLALGVAAAAGLCDALVPLGFLTAGFVAELLGKHGFKFSTEHVQVLVQEEVGVLPFIAAVILMPGFHKAFRVLALVPFGLAALVSLASSCRYSSGMPGFLGRALAPLTEVSARYQLMQARADSELLLGLALVVGAFTQLCAPLSPVLYWNVMTMRYALSPWTQASYRKIDGLLSPVLSRIPGVSMLYIKFKALLHGFAVPSERGATRCTIL